MPELIPGQTDLLRMMMGIVNVEEHQQRLAALLSAQRDAEARIAEADRKEVALRGREEAVIGKIREYEQKEKTLAEVSNGVNEEKARWEEMRRKVDAEQEKKAYELQIREDAVAAREKAAAELDESASKLRGEAADLVAAYRGMISDILAAIKKHGVET